MIRHALAEGLLLVRQRAVVSLTLAMALAVPLCLAGVTLAVASWLGSFVDLRAERSVVAVLLHPHVTDAESESWRAELARQHPEWTLELVPAAVLEERLVQWFPYLREVLDGDAAAMLPPLVEVSTAHPDEVEVVLDSPAVLAVGPRSSLIRRVGVAAARLAWSFGLVAFLLLVSAALLVGVWVHLELFRHADEITVMRLVGATEATVRGPFLVAVALPSLVAVVLAALGSWMLISLVSQVVTVLGLAPVRLSPWAVVLEIVLGGGLPVAAALITLQRHVSRGDVG